MKNRPIIINYQQNQLVLQKSAEITQKTTPIDWTKLFEELTTEPRSTPMAQVTQKGLRSLLKYIKEHYKYVRAAGGVVFDREGLCLLMTRNDRPDLPKGKVEAGETLAEAAIRETHEETGLTHLTLGKQILKTYHIYNLYGGWHFKQTTWYAMQTDTPLSIMPQVEEGITSIRWRPLSMWYSELSRSYATMQLIARTVREKQPFTEFCQ